MNGQIMPMDAHCEWHAAGNLPSSPDLRGPQADD